MNINTTKGDYIDTVQMVEIYQHIQSIIDRVREFDLNEAIQDKETMMTWMSQLNEIQRDAEYIDNMKEVLLNHSIYKMMDFIRDE